MTIIMWILIAAFAARIGRTMTTGVEDGWRRYVVGRRPKDATKLARDLEREYRIKNRRCSMMADYRIKLPSISACRGAGVALAFVVTKATIGLRFGTEWYAHPADVAITICAGMVFAWFLGDIAVPHGASQRARKLADACIATGAEAHFVQGFSLGEQAERYRRHLL